MENKKLGVQSGLLAYIFWGVLGVFWELMHSVPAMDILSYRIVWSMLTIAIILTIRRDWPLLFNTIKQLAHTHKLKWLILASFLISANWFIYIYMVTHQAATEASLGYYIMPLMNVVVAVLFLHEHLSKTRIVALTFVVIGVAILTFQTGSLPLNTLLMAGTFCLYSLIKKKVPLPALISLTLETLFVFPIAIIYLLLTPYNMLQGSPHVTILIILSGLVTIIPLLLFAVAAKNIDFITLSFIQYLNPTMQLLMAIFILNEAFTWHKAIVFILIWIGIAVFVYGSIQSARQTRQIQNKSRGRNV